MGSSNENFNNIYDAEKFLIHNISDCIQEENTIDGNKIVIPKYNMSIMPRIEQLKENMANTSYFIDLPDYDTILYECSAAPGKDCKTAIGMAQGSFMFGILETVFCMLNKVNPRKLTTEFSGNVHNWNVYLGNIVEMGESTGGTEPDFYWNILKDHIAKRIGNQKLCYVKIFASNLGNGEVSCDCMINNVKIDELSGMVAEIAKGWNVSSFSSQKQFFVIEQDKETVIDYPLTKNDLKNAVITAMKLFETCETDEDYDTMIDKLEKATGDRSLAYELYEFIPEICAENAFPEVKTSDEMIIYTGDKHTSYYKTQLESYYPIYNSVFEAFESGVFNDVNAVYKKYVMFSSFFKALNNALNNDSKLENLKMTAIAYGMDDDYIAR